MTTVPQDHQPPHITNKNQHMSTPLKASPARVDTNDGLDLFWSHDLSEWTDHDTHANRGYDNDDGEDLRKPMEATLSVSDLRVISHTVATLTPWAVASSLGQDLPLSWPCEPDDEAMAVLLPPIVDLAEPDEATEWELPELISLEEDESEPQLQPQPQPSLIPRRRGRAATVDDPLTQARRLQQLRSEVAQLQLLADSSGGPHQQQKHQKQQRIDRTLARLQRVTCGLALENYHLRRESHSRAERDAFLLTELGSILYHSATMSLLHEAIDPVMCQRAIHTTAQRVAESRLKFTSEHESSQMLGWQVAQTVEGTGTLSYALTKSFHCRDHDRVTTDTWKVLGSAAQYTAITGGSRMRVLQQLSDNAFVVVTDFVAVLDGNEDGEDDDVFVERELCLISRVRTTMGVVLGLHSLAPGLWQGHAAVGDRAVRFVEKGVRWIEFQSDALSGELTMIGGGQVTRPSRPATERWSHFLLALVTRWESAFHEQLEPVVGGQ